MKRDTKNVLLSTAALFVAIFFLAAVAQAEPIVITADSADAETQEIIALGTSFTGNANTAPKDPDSADSGTGRALNYNDTQDQTRAYVIPFLLPSSLDGQTVGSANLNINLVLINRTPNFNCDVYGLDRIDAAAPTVIKADHYLGPLDSSNTLVADDFVTPSSTLGDYVISGQTLTDFLNTQLSAGAAGKYIFFRINADLDGNSITAPLAEERQVEFQFSTGNSGTAPTLEINPVPEPGTISLLLFGALSIALLYGRRKR